MRHTNLMTLLRQMLFSFILSPAPFAWPGGECEGRTAFATSSAFPLGRFWKIRKENSYRFNRQNPKKPLLHHIQDRRGRGGNRLPLPRYGPGHLLDHQTTPHLKENRSKTSKTSQPPIPPKNDRLHRTRRFLLPRYGIH